MHRPHMSIDLIDDWMLCECKLLCDELEWGLGSTSLKKKNKPWKNHENRLWMYIFLYLIYASLLSFFWVNWSPLYASYLSPRLTNTTAHLGCNLISIYVHMTTHLDSQIQFY